MRCRYTPTVLLRKHHILGLSQLTAQHCCRRQQQNSETPQNEGRYVLPTCHCAASASRLPGMLPISIAVRCSRSAHAAAECPGLFAASVGGVLGLLQAGMAWRCQDPCWQEKVSPACALPCCTSPAQHGLLNCTALASDEASGAVTLRRRTVSAGRRGRSWRRRHGMLRRRCRTAGCGCGRGSVATARRPDRTALRSAQPPP